MRYSALGSQPPGSPGSSVYFVAAPEQQVIKGAPNPQTSIILFRSQSIHTIAMPALNHPRQWVRSPEEGRVNSKDGKMEMRMEMEMAESGRQGELHS